MASCESGHHLWPTHPRPHPRLNSQPNPRSNPRSNPRPQTICRVLIVLVVWSASNPLVSGQCPWPRTPHHVSLHSDCVCGYSNVRRLSVQCSPVANFTQLLEVLHSPSVQRLPIDLLYVNNATGLSLLPKNAFKRLDIQQIHLVNTRLDTIERGAFAGLEHTLLSLTLQSIGLREIPVAELRTLRSLRTLDLSQNRIARLRSDTFAELGQLATLRLAFNPDLQMDRDSLVGLERSLKNLNLKAIGAKHVPEAIRNLTELAFLDLAQNKIEEIRPRIFENLHSLTALSLERNFIRSVHPDTFVGLNDSLSSLSLLNNLLVDFPQKALTQLTGLRVLDLGFNAIKQLPNNAFTSNTLLTLLALDGNPMKTLSLSAFQHLNNTLRGISIGGKLFECDCKVRWLAEWANEYSLQITSRERNPQFCSKPVHLRSKSFTHVDLDDFICDSWPQAHASPPLLDASVVGNSANVVPSASVTVSRPATTSVASIITTTTSTTTNRPSTGTFPVVQYEHTSTTTVDSTETSTSTQPSSTRTLVTTSSAMTRPATSYIQVIAVDEPSEGVRTRALFVPSTTTESSGKTVSNAQVTVPREIVSPPMTTAVVHDRFVAGEATPHVSGSGSSSVVSTKTTSSSTSNSNKPRHRSNGAPHRTTVNQPSIPDSLRLVDTVYRNNSIWLRWESSGANNKSPSGYQVVYRYFGSKEFHKSEPIPARQTSYTLSHYIAPNELIVICVLSLDDNLDELHSMSDTAIPSSQCRELTTRETIIKKVSNGGSTRVLTSTTIHNNSSLTSLSSLYPSLKRLNDIDKIVIAVSAAVCLFIILAVLVFSCCFYRSVSKESPLRTVLAATNAKCLSTKSVSPVTKSSLDHHEWDAVSVYSTRSIPRARIVAHLASHPPIPPPTITGTIRSHISAHNGPTTTAPPPLPPITHYFGATSTLPNQVHFKSGRMGPSSAWPPTLDPYLHHYPSVNNLPVVSYGTTVTATGGGQTNGTGGATANLDYFSDSSYVRVSNTVTRDRSGRGRDYYHPHYQLHEKGSSSSSSNHNNNQPRGHHRSRKSRPKAPNGVKLFPLSGVGGGSGNGSGNGSGSGGRSGSGGARGDGGSGSSYNRLLLSSSSNSFQSQNDYDSDNNNAKLIHTNHHSSIGHWNPGTVYSNPRMLGGAASSRMNDNEVDIYVDQNYARRFI